MATSYFGLFLLVLIEGFGVPVPGETSIILASGAAGQGKLNIFVVGIVAFLGAVIGDSIGYWIGRAGGRPLVLRYRQYVRLAESPLARAGKVVNPRRPGGGR